MKVSVLIITYNQEKFIAQAIESVLMQEVNFDYEIVIGEDHSTDGTRNIIIDYSKRYPDRIRPLLHEKNLGLWGKNNLITTLEACQGQYIALLEGDDYWTSPHKIQKQADLLDSHPEYAICFHNVTAFYEDGSHEPRKLCPANQKEISDLEDLLVNNFVATCSAMFQSGLISEIPGWFYTVKMGDWPFHILNAQHGQIGYINEAMAAYRIHAGGIWSEQSRIGRWQEDIKLYENLNPHLNFRYSRIIKTRMSEIYYRLARAHESNGDLHGARAYALSSIKTSPLNGTIPKASLLRLFVRLYAPALYRFAASLRRSCQKFLG